jgi:hypothetical protein
LCGFDAGPSRRAPISNAEDGEEFRRIPEVEQLVGGVESLVNLNGDAIDLAEGRAARDGAGVWTTPKEATAAIGA